MSRRCSASASAPRIATSGDGAGGDGEDGAEQDLLGGAGGWRRRGAQVQEQGGQADGGAEHDAGGQVAPAQPLDADQVHHAGPGDAPTPTKPGSGLSPISSAPEPPAAETSPSAWPAKDWPRMTVNTPTTRTTTATTPPIEAATWTCGLAKKPGSKTAVDSWCMAGQPFPARRARGGRAVRRGGARPRAGDDQDAAVHVQHVDVVAVQRAKDLGGDDLVGGPAGRPAAGQVDDRGP